MSERNKEVNKVLVRIGIGIAIGAIVISFLVAKHPAHFDYSSPKTVTEVGQCTRGSSDRQVCAIRLDTGNSIEVDRIHMVGDTVYQHCYINVDKETGAMSDWCWSSVHSRNRYGSYNEARAEALEYSKEVKE